MPKRGKLQSQERSVTTPPSLAIGQRTIPGFFQQPSTANRPATTRAPRTGPCPVIDLITDDEDEALHTPAAAAPALVLAPPSPNKPGREGKGKGKGKAPPGTLERSDISRDLEQIPDDIDGGLGHSGQSVEPAPPRKKQRRADKVGVAGGGGGGGGGDGLDGFDEDDIRRATQASLEDGSGGGGSSEPMSGDDEDQGPSCLPAVTSGTKLRKMKAKNSDVNPITKKTGGDEEDAGELLNKWCPQAATMEHTKRYTAMHEGVRSAPIDERPGELLRRAGVLHADVIGPLLDQVLSEYSRVDAILVGEAQARANTFNQYTLKEFDPDASVFRPNGQLFRGSGPVSIMGGYPTSSVLDGPAQDKLLGDQGNATVQTLSMLMGLPRGADLGDDHLLSNRIFTTLQGKYTEVPTQSHYGMFHPGLVEYRTNLLAAGVKVFVEVTRSNLGSLKEALLRNGPTESLRRYELLHVNGTSLELLATPQGDAVLVVLPHEHLSHVLWSQLNEAGRLQLLLGFHAVFGVLAALLGRRPPRIDDLLTAVKAKTLKPTGIVAGSGAYMEACMRSKLFVFIAVHGEAEGRARWLAWYTECKTRAGKKGGNASWTGRSKGLSEEETRAAVMEAEKARAAAPEEEMEKADQVVAAATKKHQLATTAKKRQRDGGRAGGKGTQGHKITSSGGSRGARTGREPINDSSVMVWIGLFRRAYKITEGEKEGEVKISKGRSNFFRFRDVRGTHGNKWIIGKRRFDSNGTDKTLSYPADDKGNMVTGKEWDADPEKGLYHDHLVTYARNYLQKRG